MILTAFKARLGSEAGLWALVAAALALTHYFYILAAQWLAFLAHGEEAAKAPTAVPDRSVSVE